MSDVQYGGDSPQPTISEDEVVLGRKPDVRHFTKFGYNSDLDTGDGDRTIWPVDGVNFTPLTSAETLTITYNSSTDGDGTTGATLLFIDYIDANGNAVQTTHTLGDDGSDVTTFTVLGINRVAVSASGSNEVNENDITLTATTSSTVQAFVPAGDGVTQQAIYHVPTNASAVARLLFLNSDRITSGNPRLLIRGLVWNRNIETKFEVFRCVLDTGAETTLTIPEPVGFGLSSGDVLYFEASTSSNNTYVICRFSLREYQNV